MDGQIWYLQDIGNVNGLISCRLSTIPITNLIRLVMAKANISKPKIINIESQTITDIKIQTYKIGDDSMVRNWD